MNEQIYNMIGNVRLVPMNTFQFDNGWSEHLPSLGIHTWSSNYPRRNPFYNRGSGVTGSRFHHVSVHDIGKTFVTKLAKAKQHWDKDKDNIKVEHKGEIVKIKTRAVEDGTPPLARVCTLNWEEGFTKEEEETYLKFLVPITNVEMVPVKNQLDANRELLEQNLRKDLMDQINPQGV